MKFSVTLALLSTAPATAHLRALQGYPFDISPQEMGEFRSQRLVKAGTDLSLQEEGSDGSFIIGGQVITKKACKAVDAYVPEGATYSSGGKSQGSAPKSGLCSVNVGGQKITVSRNPNSGKVDYVLALDESSGSSSTIVPIKDGILATIKDSDLDDNALKRFDLGDPRKTPGARRHTQEEENQIAGTAATMETGHRSLQTACVNGDKRLIRVAIAYDSSFCAAVGGSNSQAIDRITAIVLATNNYYDQTGLCKLVQIAHLDSGCEGNDFFSNAVDQPGMCTSTGSNDVLYEFQQKWRSSSTLSSVERATAHLFFGNGGYTGGTIGCAFLDALCSTSYGYGVNYMTWNGDSTLVLLQSLLFSHELGHNAGSDHDAGGGFIMESSLTGNAVEFSSSSKTQINDHISTRSTSCIPTITVNSCSSNSDCNDDNTCTDDICSGGSCTNEVNMNNSCSDGDSCTGNDTCTSAGVCVGTWDYVQCPECTSNADCNDFNSCTDDSCSSGRCTNSPEVTNSCTDNDSCTTNACTSSGSCSSNFDWTLPGCVPNCPVVGENCKWAACCPGLSCKKYKGDRTCV